MTGRQYNEPGVTYNQAGLTYNGPTDQPSGGPGPDDDEWMLRVQRDDEDAVVAFLILKRFT